MSKSIPHIKPRKTLFGLCRIRVECSNLKPTACFEEAKEEEEEEDVQSSIVVILIGQRTFYKFADVTLRVVL